MATTSPPLSVFTPAHAVGKAGSSVDHRQGFDELVIPDRKEQIDE
jgi:hypothetical protein